MASIMNIIKNVDRVNEFQYRNNAFTSKFSLNPAEKELSEARYYCKNQLTKRSLKTVFVSILLPILLLVLIIYFGNTNGKIYAGLGVWIIGGLAYTVIRSGIDTKIEWDINHSNVTKDNCGF